MKVDKQRNDHLVLLLILLLVIVLIGIALATQHYLPQLNCPIHASTGLLCPGCGATTSIQSLLNGDLTTAFRSNPLFVIGLFSLTILSFFAITFRLFKGKPPQLHFTVTRGLFLIAIILMFTIARNSF